MDEDFLHDAPVTETSGYKKGLPELPFALELPLEFAMDGYQIANELGRGGSGKVYRAISEADGRQVAIKVMHGSLITSPPQVQRFMQEIAAISSIRHPAIVTVYDSGYLDDGRPYLVMEFVRGQSLSDYIKDRGRLSPPETLALLEPICAALACAHNAGIVHRDIKASNIVVVEGEAADESPVKLLDFGIAKLLNAEPGESVKTSAGRLLGSPQSMAPEQIAGGRVGPYTDIYALGVLLYFALTGQPPFRGAIPLETLEMHISSTPPEPSAMAPVGPAMDAVVACAMAKLGAERYVDVMEFVDAVRSAAAEGDGASVHVANDSHTAAAANAWGICMSVRGGDAETFDDALIADENAIFDIALEAFDAAGMQILLQTSDALLAVCAAEPEGVAADKQRRFLIEFSLSLQQAIASRAHGDDRNQVQICLHCASAEIFAGDATGRFAGEIDGGEIADIDSWAFAPTSESGPSEVHATWESLWPRDPQPDAASRYVRVTHYLLTRI